VIASPEYDDERARSLELVLGIACMAGPRTEREANAIRDVANIVNERVPHADHSGSHSCLTCQVTRYAFATVEMMRTEWEVSNGEPQPS